MNAQDKEGFIGGLIGVAVIAALALALFLGIIPNPEGDATPEIANDSIKQEEKAYNAMLDSLLQDARGYFGKLEYEQALVFLEQSKDKFVNHQKYKEWQQLHKLLAHEVFTKAKYLYETEQYEEANRQLKIYLKHGKPYISGEQLDLVVKNFSRIETGGN